MAWWLMGVSIAAAGGCEAMSNAPYTTDARKQHGLVVILPGIEGPSPMNADIRRGLLRAGVEAAMPIYAWGRPVPVVGSLLNQVDVLGNRLAGRSVARFVSEYQNTHPGRPVYLVGHSGGGGVAVFAAEAMPDGKQLDGLVLLSASISAGYDLSGALANCRGGIVNFYNPADTALLGVGTTIVGNVDGVHGPSAGRDGFRRTLAGLYQRVVHGSGDPHAAATRPHFVAARVAPWVLSRHWPPGRLVGRDPRAAVRLAGN
jgi:pimeloyl-ACP methyl ester carboxylesterase